jgi:hypothetical protein
MEQGYREGIGIKMQRKETSGTARPGIGKHQEEGKQLIVNRRE